MYVIIGSDKKEYGPVSADQIKTWITQGRANGETLAQAIGTTQWKLLSAFEDFAGVLGSSAPPPLITQSPAAAAATRASAKIPAGICGILLGCFGIHKFILGYTGPGLIMLLVTVLTCGIAGFVTWVIGLIEGIIYLTKSDEEFVRLYVDGRKEWF